MVWHRLPKPVIAGSSPVSCSKKNDKTLFGRLILFNSEKCFSGVLFVISEEKRAAKFKSDEKSLEKAKNDLHFVPKMIYLS